MPATEEQLEVIRHRGGHLLVPAVPGSGKTYAMVERVISLLQDGVPANRMLVLMFNVSAREDFQKRLRARISEHGLPMPDVLTFHAFGLRLCKALEKKGLLPRYELNEHAWVMQKMARAAIAVANEGLTEEDKIEVDSTNVEQLLEYVEFAKNELAEISRDGLPKVPASFVDAIRCFEDMRHENRLRSFTDLLYDPTRVVMGDDSIKSWVADRYDFIIGDEAQDMNQLQITLLSIIAGTRAQVCIVGDEDQSIYEWRGSRPEFMVHLFEQQFPNAVRLPLTRTFRYGHQVSLLANHVVTKNKLRIDKQCVPGTDRKTHIEVLFHKNGDEGEQVLATIGEWRRNGGPYEGCAVLVREYSHSVTVETAFLESRIPYKIVGAPPFFMRREALALRGSLLMANDALDSVVDPEARREMFTAMFSVPASYLKSEVVDEIARQSYPTSDQFIERVAMLAADRNLPAGTRKKLTERMGAWMRCYQNYRSATAAQFMQGLTSALDMEAAIFREAGKHETAVSRWRTITAIIDIAQRNRVSVTDMVSFLDTLKERYDAMSGDSCVLVTSIHRAKGLEWEHVIVPGLRDGTFPSYSEGDELDDELMEAERRLYYVAATRAMKRLTLIAPHDQQLLAEAASGQHEPSASTRFIASRFLYESNLQWSMTIGAELENGGLTENTVKAINSRQELQTKVIRRYLAEVSPAAS